MEGVVEGIKKNDNDYGSHSSILVDLWLVPFFFFFFFSLIVYIELCYKRITFFFLFFFFLSFFFFFFNLLCYFYLYPQWLTHLLAHSFLHFLIPSPYTSCSVLEQRSITLNNTKCLHWTKSSSLRLTLIFNSYSE